LLRFSSIASIRHARWFLHCAEVSQEANYGKPGTCSALRHP
jgi:hypothetical protein